MCGIAGVFGVKSFPKLPGSVLNGKQMFLPNKGTYLKKNFNNLFHISELRGHDSAGVILAGDEKHEPMTYKAVCQTAVFLTTRGYENAINAADWDIAVGHSRATTVGGNGYDSAHPHHYGSVFLVHNGTVRGHHQYLKGCPVVVSDSSAIAWKISQLELDEVPDLLTNLPDFGVLVWYDKRDNSLNIAKDESRTLFWTYPKKSGNKNVERPFGYFSSQREALAFVNGEGAQCTREVPPFVHFKYKDGVMREFSRWDKYQPPKVNNTFDTKNRFGFGRYSFPSVTNHPARGPGYYDDLDLFEEDQEWEDEQYQGTTETHSAVWLEKGTRIKLKDVADVGVNKPLTSNYRCPLTDTQYKVLIDYPPLSMFEEYEELVDLGGVVEIKWVDDTTIRAFIPRRPGRLNIQQW